MEHNKTPQQVFQKRQAHAAQVTAEEQALHKDAREKYPELSLSPGEYVLEEVRRHPIGLIGIWAITGILMFVTVALVPLYSMSMDSVATTLQIKQLPAPEVLVMPALLLAAIFALGGMIATYVYRQNRFYLTTESIIQFVQYSLFNSKQQVVNLINVEDVSADRIGVLQQLLDYGTLRLSTQGEETIYRFQYVASPNAVVHRINDATEIAIQRLEGSKVPPTELAG